jgi:hypothetical protein
VIKHVFNNGAAAETPASTGTAANAAMFSKLLMFMCPASLQGSPSHLWLASANCVLQHVIELLIPVDHTSHPCRETVGNDSTVKNLGVITVPGWGYEHCGKWIVWLAYCCGSIWSGAMLKDMGQKQSATSWS